MVLNDLAAAAPDEAVVPAFDARGVSWDIDVESYASHPRVRYYLGYFQGPARERMEIFLARAARYESMIRARFQAEGLPGDLGYLALIESGYSSEAAESPFRSSRRWAQNGAQPCPSTASWNARREYLPPCWSL